MKKIKDIIKQFGLSIAKGDIWVKLSLIIMGAGYFGRKQIVKGIIMTLFEVAFIWFTATVGVPNLSKFGTLGTVQFEQKFDIVTMTNVVNDYDNSFLILLLSIISLIFIVMFVVIYMANMIHVYNLQVLKAEGKRINTFKQDCKSYINEKFHITLLTLPIAGVVIFTVVPLIIMIAVAFTNYDQNHMPPSALFTWVGFKNFIDLFTTTTTVTFGYSFRVVLGWTFVWAVFATFTTYFGGIMLAKFLNNPKTKCSKLWRSLFVVTIAVPQFVSLLVVRNFFANTGIVNALCSEWVLQNY